MTITRRRTQADRNADRAKRLWADIRDLYRRARAESWQHSQIVEGMGPIWERAKGLPGYWREYLRGAADTETARIWADEVIWRLGPAEGPLEPETGPDTPARDRGWDPSTDGSTPGPLSILARTPGALYGAHFWRGTSIPFTPYECTNRAAS